MYLFIEFYIRVSSNTFPWSSKGLYRMPWLPQTQVRSFRSRLVAYFQYTVSIDDRLPRKTRQNGNEVHCIRQIEQRSYHEKYLKIKLRLQNVNYNKLAVPVAMFEVGDAFI